MDFNLLIEKIEALPSLPQAYHKCCYLLEQESTDSNNLAIIVSSDLAMTVMVLRVVNSALYNLPRKIERIDHAISIIGHQKFKELILTTVIVDAMSKLSNSNINMEAFWRHSVFTGLIAKRLALYSYFPNADRLHTAGLVHDVGQLIYFTMLGTKALKVCELVSKFKIEPRVAEQKVLGFNHHAIGAALCKAWKLPNWLIDVVSYYNEPESSTEFVQECRVVSLANKIANQYFPDITSLSNSNTGEINFNSEVFETKLPLSLEHIEMATEEALEQLEDILMVLVPKLRMC